MIRQVIFRPEAVDNVAEAAAWYEERSPGLAEDLIDQILLATDRAARDPQLFRIVRAKGEVRRVLTEHLSLSGFLFRSGRNTLRARGPARRAA